MPEIPTGASAPPGVRLPGSDGRYAAVMLGLSLAAGGAVIAHNCYQDRTRGLSQGRGRTVLTRPVVVVTNTVAMILIVNALICSFAPHYAVVIEVPDSLGILYRHVHTLGKAEAITLTVLAQGALTINSLYTWFIYQLGCQLSNVTLAPWRVALIHAYIWGIDTLPFLVYNVYYQLRMRTKNFRVVPDADPGFTWMALTFTVTAFVLHIVLNIYMVFRFIQGVKALTQHTHILKEERLAELHSLNVKATVYSILSLLFYVYIFTCFLVYPVNTYLSQVTTPFHLALLLSLQFCFNTKLPTPAPRGPGGGAGPQHLSPLEEEEEEEGVELDTLSHQGGLDRRTGSGAGGGGWGLGGLGEGKREDGSDISSLSSASPRRSKRQRAVAAQMPLSPLERGGGSPLDGSSPKSPGWRLFGSRRQRHKRMVAGGAAHADSANWRPWRLPSLSRVFSNPWETERGVVFRISEAPSHVTTSSGVEDSSRGTLQEHSYPSSSLSGTASRSGTYRASSCGCVGSVRGGGSVGCCEMVAVGLSPLPPTSEEERGAEVECKQAAAEASGVVTPGVKVAQQP